jgi:hypothetical protein
MDCKFEIEGIKEAKNLLSSRLFQEILKYTNQDIAKGARTMIKEKIQEGYFIRPSDLNAAMKIKTGKDSTEQILQIRGEKRGIPIFKLAGRQAVKTTLGTWIQVQKKRGAYFIPQAFISIMGSGHKGIFIRFRGGSGKGGRVGRMPIHEIYGPRITSLVGSSYMLERIKTFMKENAQRIFNQKLKWKTGGALGKE